MPSCAVKVRLVEHTPDMESLIALSARLCYADADFDTLEQQVAKRDQTAFLQGVIGAGHLSVMEHASFTFFVQGVSRTLLAQLTRHRIASFSVRSQRYVSMEKGFAYVVPPSIAALGQDAVAEYEAQMQTMHQWYVTWQARLGGSGEKANEDARFVLPNACETRIMFTMNARELLHFFSLRCCYRAQWEIRALADNMLRLVCEVAPALFACAGSPCVAGMCPEGERSCGRQMQMLRHNRALKAQGK